MRRRAVFSLILVAAVITSTGGPTVGTESRAAGRSPMHHRAAGGSVRTTTISDPQDIEEPCEAGADCPIDIRSVSRRRFTTDSGRKMLAFSVRAYELYGGLNFVLNTKLRLDTRAGPRPDARIFMAVVYLWADVGWACGRHYEAGDITHKYTIRVKGERLTCLVPRRELHPTKRIRFVALSRGKRFVVDRAPDDGWGGG